jgi:hypothetical protein
MSKKGLVAPVFKYIFVVIAGAMILLFFVKFAMDMVGSKEKANTAEIGFVIEDSLTALSVSEDQSESIPSLPWVSNVELGFGKLATCGKYSSGSSQYSSTKIIFSPSKLEGDQIQAWTRTWDYPFKVDNFFFLTNKNSKYFLAYDSSTKDFVESIDSSFTPAETLEHIPKSFEVESIPMGQVLTRLSAPTTNTFTKFVFFNTAPNIPSTSNAKYVRVDYVDCESDKDDVDCRGSLTFPAGKKSFFVGKTMLYGAIMADDFDAYSCQLSKVYRRLGIVIDLYSEKADLLYAKDMQDTSDDCNYDNVKSNLDAFKTELANAKADPDYDSFDNFNLNKNNLIGSNDQLGDNSACTALF